MLARDTQGVYEYLFLEDSIVWSDYIRVFTTVISSLTTILLISNSCLSLTSYKVVYNSEIGWTPESTVNYFSVYVSIFYKAILGYGIGWTPTLHVIALITLSTISKFCIG